MPVSVFGGETMGTRWNVLAVVPRPCSVDPIRTGIAARLESIVAQMSHWSDDSLLSRFNRAPPGQWTTLPPDFATVVARGLSIAAITGGAYDPTIGRLVDLWGYGATPVDAQDLPPSAGAILSSLATSGWERLTYTAGDRRLRQPGGLSLDLSGSAKGFAVDALADWLEGIGVVHSLIEIGGEFAGRGIRPDGEPWWVDLEVPPGLSIQPLRIALHGLSVATSGDYRRGAHTIDPRTGYPASHHVVSASVIADTTLDADIWATALTVTGADEGARLAARYGIAAQIVTMIDGLPAQHITPALHAMLAD